MSALELVVARFREGVEWTRNVPAAVRVTIYDKGGDLDAQTVPRADVQRLPNVGREAHTALHHLVERRETLAPVTLFCQGRPFDHAWDFHRVVRALASGAEPVDGFRWIGHLVDTDDAEGRRLFVHWSKNEDGRPLALDALHQALLGAPAPALVRFFGGGQFAVTAELARRRPPAFWEQARALAASFPDAAHCFERLWDRVFGADGIPAALRGDGPVWLKPVRRAQAARDA